MVSRSVRCRSSQVRRSWVVLLAFSMVGGLTAVSLVACQHRLRPMEARSLERAVTEPTIRVRIVRQADSVIIGSGEVLTLTAGGAPSSATSYTMRSPITLSRSGTGFRLAPQQGQAMRWATPAVRLAASSGRAARTDVIRVDELHYPEVVVARVAGSDRLDVINIVSMENYLPGVLERELYGSWEHEAFRAQAIAARTYAMMRAKERASHPFDVEATTASQAYGGAAAGYRARRGAQDTRGLVLTHRGELFTTYYSSTCGGITQHASIVFPATPAIAPLAGGRCGGWCRHAPRYRWGPIRRNPAEYARRLAAWGQVTGHAIRGLTGVRSLRVSKITPEGRPARYEVVGVDGVTHELNPEQFRVASNYTGGAAPALPPALRLHSNHVQVELTRGLIVFTDGRGFGHGVGMCQWGAQGMAKAGYDAATILGHYYPGSAIRQAYP